MISVSRVRPHPHPNLRLHQTRTFNWAGDQLHPFWSNVETSSLTEARVSLFLQWNLGGV